MFLQAGFLFFLRYSRCLTAVRQLHHNCGATNTCLAKTKAGGQKTMVGGGGRRKMTIRDAVNGYLKVSGASHPSIDGEETILTQKKSSQPTGD